MHRWLHYSKACLNGSRQPSRFTRVPCTPSELAQAAAGAVAAGAGAVHLHPRDRTGAESLAVADVGAAVAAVRNACPGTAIGVSTGLWVVGGSVRRRQALVARWAGLAGFRRPDFASVNVHEPGFADLVAVLREGGVGIEPGVWSTGVSR
jgi:uncharacterized protein (DUF849 family)